MVPEYRLRAYPSETEATRNRILLDFFIRAFPDTAQRRYIWDKDPADLVAAATATLRYEGIHKTEQQWASEGPTTVVAQSQQLVQQQQPPRKQVRALKTEVDALRAELCNLRQAETAAIRAVGVGLCPPLTNAL